MELALGWGEEDKAGRQDGVRGFDRAPLVLLQFIRKDICF